ncbi:tyrosine protein kinase [Anaerocolumna cellulosilytica]|uniref:non-specific protein-tyrosine kinase n=1 Tax=Anaerocolumna cellulosilytica TaxID=433286 RepID=A0A6S6RBZ2_9FIRM|nr:CpsD/CapB family tyrosine-protein kinase [Anaerocolumna cellulosilytica]MBB5195269.1 capsular exopolysaccharide synthesis family protein [Anaerocolumna cellulosilytica]BCJ96742.1 tyrosine protein kinase [Anaerocolumna cellulosilytica]
MNRIASKNGLEPDYWAKEAYKTLRSNIQFLGDDIQVITFTSCTPNKENTNVSFKLAESFVKTGKRLLLIDADLRESALHKPQQNKEGKKGLTHYLTNQCGIGDVIIPSDVEDVDLILAGTKETDTTELLGQQKFEEMIGRLRNSYDYIFINTPPVGVYIDSAIVAGVSDGVVIVIESNAINRRFAKEAKEQLEASKCRILGVVLYKAQLGRKRFLLK